MWDESVPLEACVPWSKMTLVQREKGQPRCNFISGSTWRVDWCVSGVKLPAEKISDSAGMMIFTQKHTNCKQSDMFPFVEASVCTETGICFVSVDEKVRSSLLVDVPNHPARDITVRLHNIPSLYCLSPPLPLFLDYSSPCPETCAVTLCSHSARSKNVSADACPHLSQMTDHSLDLWVSQASAEVGSHFGKVDFACLKSTTTVDRWRSFILLRDNGFCCDSSNQGEDGARAARVQM